MIDPRARTLASLCDSSDSVGLRGSHLPCSPCAQVLQHGVTLISSLDRAVSTAIKGFSEAARTTRLHKLPSALSAWNTMTLPAAKNGP